MLQYWRFFKGGTDTCLGFITAPSPPLGELAKKKPVLIIGYLSNLLNSSKCFGGVEMSKGCMRTTAVD